VSTSSPHFDDLSTSWTLLQKAHDSDTGERVAAQAILVQRYRGVVRRYLAGALRRSAALAGRPGDLEDVLDECEQLCWIRLVEGRFAGVNPQQGRFRDYLRVVLGNLVHDWQRQKPAGELPEDVQAPEPVSDQEYREMCRHDLLERALERLRLQDEQSGQCFYQVLKARRDRPDDSMEELAHHLSTERERTAGWVRTMVFRARQRLCELLRQDVASELDNPTREAVDAELAELGLLVFCK
jgi:RNA polymerase sigma factor (sigma-70 family)